VTFIDPGSYLITGKVIAENTSATPQSVTCTLRKTVGAATTTIDTARASLPAQSGTVAGLGTLALVSAVNVPAGGAASVTISCASVPAGAVFHDFGLEAILVSTLVGMPPR
jgi:hypothetical protein